jgi:hypothetical protein
MPRFDPTSSECRVYTRRTGVLSAIGHDLELAVDRYEIDVEEAPLRVRASFDAGSLRVLGAIKGGALLAGELSTGDRAQIDRQVAEEVLEAGRHPQIEFASTQVGPAADGYRVRGLLRLHGAERPIAFSARRSGGRLEAEVVLHQPDFGIKPYRAFGGALRLHPDVRVRIRLPELSLGTQGTRL